MIYLSTILLSLLIALMRGGRLRKEMPVRYSWLPLVAYGLHATALSLPSRWEDAIATALIFVTLIAFAYFNFQLLGLRFLVVGLLLNGLVMVANGGRMPVDPQAAARVNLNLGAIDTAQGARHAVMTEASRLRILGDVIPIPFGMGSKVLSIGDLFVLLGGFVLVQELMPAPRSQESLGSS